MSADEVNRALKRSGDGIDMECPVTVVSRELVYQGAIFSVEDMRLALHLHHGGRTVIRRQVMRHAPCVVMLVHDLERDLYLIEREYRVGSDMFAYGLPAGLIDDGEDVEQAALRELVEETGVQPAGGDDITFDHVGEFYSSEGMTDELAHIMVIHLGAWQSVERHFDADEHVESAWITWERLRKTRITASNSMIAIQHEQIRRMQGNTRP
ncbi:NUDIX hydrolase [Bifidobacterium moukalabense]|uniref:NUDIX hydrolase n=1 Tax=Bifidobacterium moukalabense TaxID=1333651 RepID=UPI0010F7042B|nr:NUDIX hydrolase [Bifidobacterium moukalabense]